MIVKKEPIVFLNILLISATDHTLALPTVKAIIDSCLEFVVRFIWIIQIGRNLINLCLDAVTLREGSFSAVSIATRYY